MSLRRNLLGLCHYLPGTRQREGAAGHSSRRALFPAGSPGVSLNAFGKLVACPFCTPSCFPVCAQSLSGVLKSCPLALTKNRLDAACLGAGGDGRQPWRFRWGILKLRTFTPTPRQEIRHIEECFALTKAQNCHRMWAGPHRYR